MINRLDPAPSVPEFLQHVQIARDEANPTNSTHYLNQYFARLMDEPLPHAADVLAADHLINYLGLPAMMPIVTQMRYVTSFPYLHSMRPYAFATDGDDEKRILAHKMIHLGSLLRHIGKAIGDDPVGGARILDHAHGIALYGYLTRAEYELKRVSVLNNQFERDGIITPTAAANNREVHEFASSPLAAVIHQVQGVMLTNLGLRAAELESGPKTDYLISTYRSSSLPENVRSAALEALPSMFEAVAADASLTIAQKMGYIEKAYYALADQGRFKTFASPESATVEESLSHALPLLLTAIEEADLNPINKLVVRAETLQRLFFFSHLRHPESKFPNILPDIEATHTDIRALDHERGLLVEGRFLMNFAGSDEDFIRHAYPRFAVRLTRADQPAHTARVALAILDEVQTTPELGFVGSSGAQDERVKFLVGAVTEAFAHVREGTNHPEVLMVFATASLDLLNRDRKAYPLTFHVLENVGRRLKGDPEKPGF